MLARANRLVSAEDYRSTLRRGSRRVLTNAVVSLVSTDVVFPARFGFIVTRKVGNAVKRNQIRRRMKAVARELVDGGLTGTDVVVRALPSCAEVGWNELHDQLIVGMRGSDRR